MMPRSRILALPILAVMLTLSSSLWRGSAAAESVIVRTNPKQYRYRGKAYVDNVWKENLGVVVYMAHPESSAFQEVELVTHTPGEVMPIPGNGDDKCLRVSFPPGAVREGERKEVVHEYIVTLYDIETDFAKITDIPAYDRESALFKLYTGPAGAPSIDAKHPEIERVAKELLASANDPLDYARKAFQVAQDGVVRQGAGGTGFSVCDPISRGGSLGGTHAVFVSLLRADGVPARAVVARGVDGFIRVWTEFYLEGYGWIPANPGQAPAEGKPRDYFFGRPGLSPGRQGMRNNHQAVIMNHVYGINELPIPVAQAKPLQYGSLAYFLIWGVSSNSGYYLEFDRIDKAGRASPATGSLTDIVLSFLGF